MEWYPWNDIVCVHTRLATVARAVEWKWCTSIGVMLHAAWLANSTRYSHTVPALSMMRLLWQKTLTNNGGKRH
eukprot:1150600-Pelagomonas_calceolata.AAC.4